jgi:hypothetical protein
MEAPKVVKQESIAVERINIQILFNDKSVKNCEVPHEVLVKIADILYEYEDAKDKANKEGIYKE